MDISVNKGDSSNEAELPKREETISDPGGAMRLDQTGRAGTPYYDALCPACASPLIQALEWIELGDEHWGVLVRCPECEASHEMVLGQEQVHDFMAAADEASRSLIDAAQYLERDVFRENCEAFTRALREGSIGPADF
jgi:hypothetical protein